MKEHIIQPKKFTTDSFSIPALRQPTRGFGSQSSSASSPAALNKSLGHDISRIPLRRPQTKLTVNQPGDIYEQEADTVAKEVMVRLGQPLNYPSIQSRQMPEEEELQMKPLASSITPVVQRQEIPEEEEEELQMKSLDNTLQRELVAEEEEEELQMSPMVQRQAKGGMAATPDLEASINQARGGGQPIADNIRQPMEQAFGADFSGVKVHTDDESDRLNQSIQARAFTTGQDLFFRQGEYNPGSQGGQELLAHELTHVVQQNGETVQRSPLPPQQLLQHPATDTPTASVGDRALQAKGEIYIQCAGNPGEFEDSVKLVSHFNKHVTNQHDAGGVYTTTNDYEQAAISVVNSYDETKTKGANTYYWKNSTSQVVVVRGGFIRTMFVPSAGKTYYDNQ